MQRLVESIGAFAASLGAPGLVLVAFLDSSFLSLPEVTDILIVVLVIKRPELWISHALFATVGSVLGCYALYFVGVKGGEVVLRRRFKAHNVERGLQMFQRYGLLAVVIPSILPPPMPFKIFVLLAGVAKVRPLTFIVAATIGRGFRYGSEALLAYWYGEWASQFIRQNLPLVSLWLAGAIAVVGVFYVLWRRRRPRTAGSVE
jgi:membrane protein YqaA with SNARE-associated domain